METTESRARSCTMAPRFPAMAGAQMKTAPPIAWMGGAARRVSAALLGALSSSHAQKPPTNKAEGAAKEEKVGAMHERELRSHAVHVKERG